MSVKRERRERMASMLAEPSTFKKLIAAIAGGDTLEEWVRSMDFIYHDVYGWVYDDKDRLAAYTRALESNKANLTDRVTSRLRKGMEVDLRRTQDAKGNPLPLHKLDDDTAAVLAGYEVSTSEEGKTTTRLRFMPRERATEQLGRHLGMFKDKLEVSVDSSLASRLGAARRRSGKEK